MLHIKAQSKQLEKSYREGEEKGDSVAHVGAETSSQHSKKVLLIQIAVFH